MHVRRDGSCLRFHQENTQHKFNKSNNADPGDLPLEFRRIIDELTSIEDPSIARCNTFLTEWLGTGGGQYKYRGNVINFFQNSVPLATHVPLLPEEVSILLVRKKDSKNPRRYTGLVNRARGTIVSILKPDLESLGVHAMILVKFDFYSGPSLPNLEQGVVPINTSSKSGKLQIPLTLAWATTIHKSQGLTLDKVTVDIGEFEFAAGLSFVALSRVRKIGDLRLVDFNYSRILLRKTVTKANS